MTSAKPAPPWSIILAGGEGMRLRPLTRRIAGDDRPKQFCRIFGNDTLLDRTRRRADLVCRPDRQVVVVTRAHRPFYQVLERELLPGRLVEQPANRGTAPGILYPLLRVRALDGDVPVIVLPSDHDVVDDAAFMGHVRSAVEVVRSQPASVVLLGIEPDYPESEYGWIEPAGLAMPGQEEAVFAIKRFWEKPTPRLAEALYRRGCLWNSFVMVGWVSGFLSLMRAAAPALLAAVEPLVAAMDSPREPAIAEEVYAGLPDVGFSHTILARVPHRLLTVRAKDVGWSDCGNPSRVLASLRRSGERPGWMSAEELRPSA